MHVPKQLWETYCMSPRVNILTRSSVPDAGDVGHAVAPGMTYCVQCEHGPPWATCVFEQGPWLIYTGSGHAGYAVQTRQRVTEKNKPVQCPGVTFFQPVTAVTLAWLVKKNDYANESAWETAWAVTMETGGGGPRRRVWSDGWGRGMNRLWQSQRVSLSQAIVDSYIARAYNEVFKKKSPCSWRSPKRPVFVSRRFHMTACRWRVVVSSQSVLRDVEGKR